MSDQKFVIKGGTPLNGELKIQGAKNSVLPIIAASVTVSYTHLTLPTIGLV